MVVLVVDDDEKVLDLFQRFMAMRKISGLFASNSNLGIELFDEKKDTIKTLIIDLTIDGSYTSINCIDHMKKVNPDLSVFVITGGLFDKYFDDLNRFTKVVKVQKPFLFNELLDDVEKLEM